MCWGLTTCQPLWVIFCRLHEEKKKRDRKHVLSRNMKNIIIFYLKIFIFFLVVKYSVYLNKRVLVMNTGIKEDKLNKLLLCLSTNKNTYVLKIS